MCSKSPLSILKQDFDAPKIEIKNAFFVFMALSHVFAFIFVYDNYSNVYDS